MALVALGLLVAAFGWLSTLNTRDIDQPDAFPVRFENDTGQPVLLALCNSDHSNECADPPYRDRIAPTVRDEENVAPDVQTEWAVETPNGKPLRCVMLYWRYAPSAEPTVQLGDAPPWQRPCPALVHKSN